MKYIYPYLYTFLYNRKGLEGWAYFFESYVALLMFVLLFMQNNFDIIYFVVSMTSVMTIYELGYIENNTQAIKKEKNPTIRHTEKELLFLKKNYYKIAFYRYMITFFLILGMSFYTNVIELIVGLIAIRISFYLYNEVFRKGITNRIIFSILRFLRYYVPISFFGEPAFLLAGIIAFVNFINNFAWYRRTKFYLPRFFGTKLFDAIIYFGIFILLYSIEDSRLSYVFLYLFIIKLVLFIIKLIRV